MSYSKNIASLTLWRVVAFRVALLLLLMALAPRPSHAAEPEETARLSEAEAIKVAREFCQNVGAPVTGDGVADYPLPPSLASAQHWQPLWRVRFAGQAHLEVVDATGNIAAYTNDALNAKNEKAGDRAPRQDINIRQAEQKAIAVVDASGNTSELKFNRADFWQITEPPSVVGQGWMVSFTRIRGTVPYRDQGAHVVVDPESGLATTFIIRFRTPPPKDSSMRISREEERVIVEKQLALAGKQGATLVTGKKLMVQPNNFWKDGEKGTVVALPISRLADVYYYKTTEDNREWTYEVWVDLDTGEVLGGAKSGAPIVIPEKADAEVVKAAFRAADEMRFYSSNDTAAQPVAILNRETHAEMLQDLKDKTYFLTLRPRLTQLVRPNEGKIVFTSGGKSYTMNYELENGVVLIASDRWGLMSNEFRAWLTKETLR